MNTLHFCPGRRGTCSQQRLAADKSRVHGRVSRQERARTAQEDAHTFATLADIAYKKLNLKTALSDFVHHWHARTSNVGPHSTRSRLQSGKHSDLRGRHWRRRRSHAHIGRSGRHAAGRRPPPTINIRRSVSSGSRRRCHAPSSSLAAASPRLPRRYASYEPASTCSWHCART
jgi:hypothetical protein